MVWEKEDVLGGWPKCTASSHDSIDEGRKSFPSGERHAASVLNGRLALAHAQCSLKQQKRVRYTVLLQGLARQP